MPILSNQRHELFAQALARGMSATDAYHEAGYKRDRFAAHKLTTKHHIKERVAELKSVTVKKTEVTLEWLVQEAVKTIKEARADKSHAACIAAIKETGILTGLRVERQSQEHEGHIQHTISDRPMTADEWEAQHG